VTKMFDCLPFSFIGVTKMFDCLPFSLFMPDDDP
jgi:hypothetical protein